MSATKLFTIIFLFTVVFYFIFLLFGFILKEKNNKAQNLDKDNY